MKARVFSLAHNTTFLSVASIVQKSISALYFFAVSWVIGTVETARYFHIFVSLAIFTVIADSGLTTALTQKLSRHEVPPDEDVSIVLLIKVILGIVAGVVLTGVNYIFDYPGDSACIIVFAAIIVISDSVRSVFYAVARSQSNVFYESIGVALGQVLLAGFGAIALVGRLPFLFLIVAALLASVGHTAYAWWCVQTRYSLRLVFPAWQSLHLVLREFAVRAWPFAVGGLLMQLYAYQDAFFIKKLLPEEDGGHWARAYKAVYAFQFIPIALGASLFPLIAREFHRSHEALSALIIKSYRFLFLVGIPIVIGGSAVITPFFARFVPQFLPAAAIFKVLVWSLLPGFLGYAHGAILNGIGRQRTQTALYGLALVSSVIGNALLIPTLGTRGAAITAIFSNILLWITGYILIRKVIHTPDKTLYIVSGKIVFSGLVMGLAVLALLATPVPLVIIPCLGGVVYGILLCLTGILRWSALSSRVKEIMPR